MAYLLKHAILLILVSPSLGMLQRINASAVVVFQEPALNKERAILTNLSYSSIGIRLHYLSSNGEVSDVLRFISLYHKEYPSLLPMIVLVNSFQERMLYEVAKYRRLENVVYSPNNCYEGTVSITDGRNCFSKYRSEYLEGIKSLVQHFSEHNIAIIHSKQCCETAIASLLSVELKSFLHYRRKLLSQREVHQLGFSLEPLSVLEIRQILNTIKALSCTFIILICQSNTAQFLSTVGATHTLLTFGTFFVTLKLNTNVKLKSFPIQLISLNLELKDNYYFSRSNLDGDVQSWIFSKLISKERKEENKDVKKSHSSPSQLNHIHFNSSQKALHVLQREKGGHWIKVMSWTEDHGILFVSAKAEKFLKQFSPLRKGVKLKVVTVLDPPFASTASYYYNPYRKKQCEFGILCHIPIKQLNFTFWNATCCIGYAIDLLQMLADDLSFVPVLHIVEDGFYGTKNNGSWNGMVGDILNGKAEIAVAGFTINQERSTVIDFSEPFMLSDLGIVLSKHTETLEFVNFRLLDFMTLELKWLLLVLFITGGVFVYLLENKEFVTMKCSSNDLQPNLYPWREGFSYFSGLTFQRDLGGKPPARCGAQVAAIGSAFAMVVITTAYTAVMTASTVIQEERHPFLGLKDDRMKKPTTSFKFATVSETSVEAFFKASSDPFYRDMYLFMRPYNTPSVTDGIKRVLNGELQAFINEYPFLKYHSSKQKNCRLKLVSQSVLQAGYGIAVKKGSLWKHHISKSILKYKEDNALISLNEKWLGGPCSLAGNMTDNHQRLPLEYFGGAYVVLAVAIAVSIVIVGIEWLYRKYTKHLSYLVNLDSTT